MQGWSGGGGNGAKDDDSCRLDARTMRHVTMQQHTWEAAGCACVYVSCGGCRDTGWTRVGWATEAHVALLVLRLCLQRFVCVALCLLMSIASIRRAAFHTLFRAEMFARRHESK